MTLFKRSISLFFLLAVASLKVLATDIKGRVTAADTHEALIGATVMVEGTQIATATDGDGNFTLSGLNAAKRYTLLIKYLSYKDKTLTDVRPETNGERLTVELAPDQTQLEGVTVSGVARRNTEAAAIEMAKQASVTVNTISAQEITRTQDSNAGEVIRRVPGVSLIDEKFVMVRGLSQRYNNVWLNGGAVPSSEADSRAFSFDIIPSGQIDNLVIVKSPSAEYPSDFSGGFIQINTKEIPAENYFSLLVGGNWNDATHLADFSYSKGSATDFLGFDNGLRSMTGGIEAELATVTGGKTVSLTDNHLNNDWRVKTKKPIGDLKLGAEISHFWSFNGHKLGLIGTLNYTNEYRTYKDMENNSYGAYDVSKDAKNYLHQYVDDQYNHNVRLGALLNLTFLSKNGNNKYQLKNIFNQLATDRYTFRTGIGAQSDNQQQAEYYYRSRTTYNLQLTGKHTLTRDEIEWSGSYSYANRNLPDRRRYIVTDYGSEDGSLEWNASNDMNREFTRLGEHILSANVNDSHLLQFGDFQPVLKVGAYGEYRTRNYKTRELLYNWDTTNHALLPAGFRKYDMTELLSSPQYFGATGLYLLEEPAMRNNYSGRNTLGAGYASAALPFGQLTVNVGVRFEFNQMELVSNLRDTEESPHSEYYRNRDLFPSVNTIYRINEKHQVRLSYGKSVNRPEFREVSPSVYHDFDLAADVQGNSNLQSCYIHNLDLRYEIYPSRGEQITIAGFYKHFDHPIEWTYTMAGGNDYIYSYENAQSANNLGVEIDLRKDLSFVGLRHFSLSLNGALIHSRVKFEEGSRFQNRPMQGQSPYLINAGLFYRNEQQRLNIAVLYNRIGKRIIGVGRSEGSSGSEDNARIPDSYEMPRNALDLSISKKFFGDHLELKANVRNLLGEKVYYKQFADVTYADGTTREIQQITRQYKLGRNFGLTASYKF